MISINHIKAIDVDRSILESSPAENWKVLYGLDCSELDDLEGVDYYVVDRNSADEIIKCRIGFSLFHEKYFDLYVWAVTSDVLVM